MGNPVKMIDPDGRWPWTAKWRKNASLLASRTGGESFENEDGSISVDYYSRSDDAMHSVNFRKGANHAGLFDNVGDPGYHFSDHASWGTQFAYWLENNFGQHGEFGPRKGSTAEVVGQEIGAIVYQAHPGSIVAELLTGMEGPQTQTVAGTGASYAMMFITPGGAARGGVSTAAKGGMSEVQLLTRVAQKAEAAIGGTGRFAGTAKHTYAKNLLNRYQSRFGGDLSLGSNYINGPTGRGFLDVVNHQTKTIYDFKFGSAVMCNSQFLKYSNSFPGYGIQIIKP
jgi:hypothetical protein